MKKLLLLVGGLLIFIWSPTLVLANSEQAYKDYLYQFDRYREKYAAFQVAKNEYEKFKTLNAETTAIDKTKDMLIIRNSLLRAYLLVLNERLNETTVMGDVERTQFKKLIESEIAFLEKNNLLIPSISTIRDADRTSKELEEHYGVLSRSMRQIILGVTLANLGDLGKRYEGLKIQAITVLSENPEAFSVQKQATIDRWIQQITNKYSFFSQKYTESVKLNTQLESTSIKSLDIKFESMKGIIADGRQDLVEGISYMKELAGAMRYAD